mgnify:CR=1 FL=1
MRRLLPTTSNDVPNLAPRTVAELLAELESAFAFNFFSMDEAFALLSNFSTGENPTIFAIVMTMPSIALSFTVAPFGFAALPTVHQLTSESAKAFLHEGSAGVLFVRTGGAPKQREVFFA